MLTSLFSLFYVTREFHRLLHRGRAKLRFGNLDRGINLSNYLRGKLFKRACIITELDLLSLCCISSIAVELVIVDNIFFSVL